MGIYSILKPKLKLMLYSQSIKLLALTVISIAKIQKQLKTNKAKLKLESKVIDLKHPFH